MKTEIETIEVYSSKLKEGADLALEFGLRKFGIENFTTDQPENWNKEKWDNYFCCYHEGFGKSQKLIIEQILYYQNEHRKCLADLKKTSREDKSQIAGLKYLIAVIERRVANFCHIADSIAWQMMGAQIIEVVNNDSGTDIATEHHINILEPANKTEQYYRELYQLHEKLKSKIWSYDVIDRCLHIGMYRDEGVQMAKIIEDILKEKTNNYLAIDWSTITENLSEPIFAKPFPQEFIIDVLVGKIKIVMGIDFNALIQTFV